MRTLSTTTFKTNPLTLADVALKSEGPAILEFFPGLGLALRLLVVLFELLKDLSLLGIGKPLTMVNGIEARGGS